MSSRTVAPPDDPVHWDSGVALKLAEGGRGQVSEDPVNPTGVEPERTEALLQLSDIVPPDHRGSSVQEPIAEPPARLHQSGPRLWTTDPVDPEPASVLEGLHRGTSSVRELALWIDATREAECLQPGLDIANRGTGVAQLEGE